MKPHFEHHSKIKDVSTSLNTDYCQMLMRTLLEIEEELIKQKDIMDGLLKN
jgi:hypothetical protein